MDLSILESGISLHSCVLNSYNQNQLLFAFTFKKYYNSVDFLWKINRSSDELANFNNSLSRVKNFSKLAADFPKVALLNPEHDQEKKIELISTYFSSVLSIVPSCSEVHEFLELSLQSFDYPVKYKEGYITKVTRSRCFCCFSISKNRRVWLRVQPKGLECVSSNSSESINYYIQFCKDFQVSCGLVHSGQELGIKVIAQEGETVFIAENIYQRNEWAEAIKFAYQKSGFWGLESRFDSSFPVQLTNSAKWFIDGQDYFSEVYSRLASAKSIVCISDWWLSPELYLKRPAGDFPDSHLVTLLSTISHRGVKVNIILYKESIFSPSLSSLHAKQTLEKGNPNISVLRHPQLSLENERFLWTHHNKIILIDKEIALIGGLDMCWGRWDTQDHNLTDIAKKFWPGKDYANVRIAEMGDTTNASKESINRNHVPRLPWHDVCVKISGPAVGDMCTHYVQVWNHIVKDLEKETHAKLLEDDGEVLTNRGREYIIQGLDSTEVLYSNVGDEKHQRRLLKVKQKAFASQERRVNNYISRGKSPGLPTVGYALPHPESYRLHQEAASWIPEHDLDQIEAQDYQRTIDRIKNDPKFSNFNSNLLPAYSAGQADCQVIRSLSAWGGGRTSTESSIHNAYIDLILSAKKFIYIENQFFVSGTAGGIARNAVADALVKRISQAIKRNEDFKVIVILPLLPSNPGYIGDYSSVTLRIQLYWQFRTINRSETSIYSQLRKKTADPFKYIKFFSTRKHGLLNNIPVTEMIYIHSKIMIVDDTTVVVGSANINDRSLVGDRDTEIAFVINDKDMIDSVMAGSRCKVSRFAHSLRMALFMEHAGEENGQMLIDPFSRDFFQVWDQRAIKNTECFRRVFRCYPDDEVFTFEQLDDFINQARPDDYSDCAKIIKGNIVDFPLQFLRDEDLSISVWHKEYLLPDYTFT